MQKLKQNIIHEIDIATVNQPSFISTEREGLLLRVLKLTLLGQLQAVYNSHLRSSQSDKIAMKEESKEIQP